VRDADVYKATIKQHVPAGTGKHKGGREMQTTEQKRLADKWAGEECTLDGKPARVLGRLNDFATIAQIPDGKKAEWTWDKVERIMYGGGSFKS